MTSSRIPLFEVEGNALSPLLNYPQEEQKRRGGQENGGGQSFSSHKEFDKSDWTSGRVRCLRGVGDPSPPPELSVGGTKEARWTGKWDR